MGEQARDLSPVITDSEGRSRKREAQATTAAGHETSVSRSGTREQEKEGRKETRTRKARTSFSSCLRPESQQIPGTRVLSLSALLASRDETRDETRGGKRRKMLVWAGLSDYDLSSLFFSLLLFLPHSLSPRFLGPEGRELCHCSLPSSLALSLSLFPSISPNQLPHYEQKLQQLPLPCLSLRYRCVKGRSRGVQSALSRAITTAAGEARRAEGACACW